MALDPRSGEAPAITHVAIRWEGQVWSLPRPFRHHDIIRTIANLTGATHVDCRDDRGDQGFLDASGRYLSRVEALPVALANKQVIDESDIRGGMLFSEDVWRDKPRSEAARPGAEEWAKWDAVRGTAEAWPHCYVCRVGGDGCEALMPVHVCENCKAQPLVVGRDRESAQSAKEVAGSTPAGVSTVAGVREPAGDWGVDPAESSTNGKPEEPPPTPNASPAPGGLIAVVTVPGETSGSVRAPLVASAICDTGNAPMTAGKDRHFSTTPTPSPATFDVGDRVMHYGEGPLEVIEVKEGWLRVADTATVKHRWLSMAGKGTTRVAPSSCPEPRETQWGWATSDAPERWDGGFATREDVIAEAAGCLGPNEPFWIMNGTSLDAGSFVPSVDWIVEHMNASACDEAGEAAEEWPQCELSNEAEAELKALLEGWARKHAPAKFWAADGTAERVDPAAQFTRKDSEK